MVGVGARVWKCEPAAQPSDAEHQNMPNQRLALGLLAIGAWRRWGIRPLGHVMHVVFPA